MLFDLVDENPQEKLRKFYIETMPLLKADLMSRYPRGVDEKESDYSKAIAARPRHSLKRSWSLPWHLALDGEDT